MSLTSVPMLLAQAAPGGLGGTNIIFFVALFAIMYFVLIRPQQRQQKEQASMLSALKKGDDVITTGGLLGKIHAVDDKVITLEVAANVKVRVLKSSVQGKVTVEPRAEASDAKDAKKEEK